MATELIANSPTPGTVVPIANLAQAITTAPAPGTQEQWTFSGPAPSALQTAGGQFRIVIDAEIMIVTAGQAGTKWTVTRGAENTTPTGHAVGANVMHYITAGALNALLAASGLTPQTGGALTPTTVKTAGTYTANAGDLVIVDLSQNSVTIALPTSGDKVQVGYKIINYAAPNILYINLGGSDAFDKANGATAVTPIVGQDQAEVYQRQASSSLWFAVGGATAEAQIRNSIDNALATSISNETTRAQTAEGANATAIGNETTRAKAAEGANTTAIGAETSRAESAEAGLTPLLNPTAVQSGTVNLAVGQMALLDASQGPLIVNLPNAPATRSQTAYKVVYTTVAAALASAGLAANTAITAIPLSAPLRAPIPNGATVTVAQGADSFTATLSAPAAAGATSLAVSSVTPAVAYTAGATITYAPALSLTVNTQGSDALEVPGGLTTLTPAVLLNAAKTLQYAPGVWETLSGDAPVSQLDARYTLAGASGPGQLPPSVLTVVSEAPQFVGTPLEGVTLISIGHSYTVANAPNPPTRFNAAPRSSITSIPAPSPESWTTTAARRLGMNLDQRGWGGDIASGTFCRLASGWNGDTLWTPGESGLAMVQAMLNDERLYGSSAAGMAGWKNSMRAILALLLSGSAVAPSASSHVHTGSGWTSGASYAAIGGTLYYTSTQGAYLDVTATPINGEVTVFSAALPTSTAVLACALNPSGSNTPITPTGGSTGTYNTANQCASDSGAAYPLGYVPIPLRFTGLGSSPVDIRITKTDSGASSFYDLGHVVPSATPPVVMCAKDAALTASDYALYSPSNNGSNAARLAFNAALDALMTEFVGYPVSDFDLNASNWNPATMIYSGDNVHPNTLGARALATTFVTAAQAVIAGFNGVYPAGLLPA